VLSAKEKGYVLILISKEIKKEKSGENSKNKTVQKISLCNVFLSVHSIQTKGVYHYL